MNIVYTEYKCGQSFIFRVALMLFLCDSFLLTFVFAGRPTRSQFYFSGNRLSSPWTV